MTDEQIALSRRAVVCKGFRWMPGMRTVEVLQAPPWTLPLWDEAIVLSAHEGDPVRVCTVLGKVRELHPLATPCLTDPATLGCLLALVRETWEPHGTFVSTHRYDGGEWSIRTLPLPVFATEAEALVAALEGAP